MIMDIAQALKRKQAEAKAKISDEALWKWLMKNSSRGFVVMLDNDQTYVADHHEDSDNDWDEQPEFRQHIGNAPGIIPLLKMFGIRAEYV